MDLHRNGCCQVDASFDIGGSDNLVVTTRVYSNSDTERASIVEVEHAVPDKIADNSELIMHVATNLKNEGKLFTDESGLEMHERDYNVSLPISGNYHVRQLVLMVVLSSTLLCALARGRQTFSVFFVAGTRHVGICARCWQCALAKAIVHFDTAHHGRSFARRRQSGVHDGPEHCQRYR